MYSDLMNWAQSVQREELAAWIAAHRENPPGALFEAADALRRRVYGDRVFFRGLIEFSNICARGCRYCGLNASQTSLHRYRMTEAEIVCAVSAGYRRGFRSFVLQSGEDPYYQSPRLVSVVAQIKEQHPDCAVTLSAGEMSEALYRALYDAGADRYLLRHETADAEHYAGLHPAPMSFQHRMKCLRTLKAVGFATGAGFMVGSPGQTDERLAGDLLFLRAFQPHMAGIGPFIPAKGTAFEAEPAGSANLTVMMVALARLMLPLATLPATTALGALGGRDRALLAGANVLMPDLTPPHYRADYKLYDGKAEVDAQVDQMVREVEALGLTADFSRGDPLG